MMFSFLILLNYWTMYLILAANRLGVTENILIHKICLNYSFYIYSQVFEKR